MKWSVIPQAFNLLLLPRNAVRGQAVKFFSSHQIPPRVAVVGSGPSGFGVTQVLLKNNKHVRVDVYEKFPVPFGLIRYGVSPDHQDVKNAINGYTKTAQSNRFRFFGNVNIGSDMSLSDLLATYHAVVLCNGAQVERKLNLPGNDAKNVFSSNQFVGWYNGDPSFENIKIDLSGKKAIIIGVGNVALDCARMLLKPLEQLKDTDITSKAFNQLKQSNINEVQLIGRRGPMQMACTRKELSEVADLPNVKTVYDKNHFSEAIQAALLSKDLKTRKQRRLVTYLQKVASSDKANCSSQLLIKFLQAPVEIITSGGKISGIKLRKYEIKGKDVYHPEIIETDTIIKQDCDLLISCIGYGNEPIDKMVPFRNGKILHEKGSVLGVEGLYACGWCSHGAQGVLADSGNDSFEAGTSLLNDLDKLVQGKTSLKDVETLISYKRTAITTWHDWEAIDQNEIEVGKNSGKVREKMVNTEKMLSFVERS